MRCRISQSWMPVGAFLSVLYIFYFYFTCFYFIFIFRVNRELVWFVVQLCNSTLFSDRRGRDGLPSLRWHQRCRCHTQRAGGASAQKCRINELCRHWERTQKARRDGWLFLLGFFILYLFFTCFVITQGGDKVRTHLPDVNTFLLLPSLFGENNSFH